MYPLGIEPAQHEIPSHKSVGGWLLLLCFSLTAILPFAVFNNLILHTIPTLAASHSMRLKTLYSVYCAVFSFASALCVIAGFKLWMLTPGAVKFAQRSLGALLSAHLGYFAFWLAFYQQHLHTAVGMMIWSHIGQPIIFFTIWFLYLERSERVRETYPAP